MATYTEKIYAFDSYTKNFDTLVETSNPTLTAETNFDFYVHSTTSSMGYQVKSGKAIILAFKSQHSPTMYKKKLKTFMPFAFITYLNFSTKDPLVSDVSFGSIQINARFEKPHFSLFFDKWDTMQSQLSLNTYQALFRSQVIFGQWTVLWKESPDNQILLQCSAMCGIRDGEVFKGDLFVADSYISIHSHLNTNPPYLLCTYEDVTPTIENMSPASGFVDKRIANVFSWKMVAEAVGGSLKQKSAVFRWRPYGTTSVYTINISGDTQSCTVPLNTFSTDYLEWQVTVTTEDNVSATSGWIKLTTIDTVPDAPNSLSPSNSYLDGERESMLTWNHNVPTGSTQKAFDLQYKQGTSWISLASHKITSDEFLLVPASTFQSGEMIWQVRTYNTDDKPSPWGVSSPNIVKAKAITPEYASISSTPQVSVTWQSIGQESWELEILKDNVVLISDWGVGSAKKWKSSKFLDDGSYVIRLRIQNVEGGWSDFAEKSFIVQNISAGDIRATAATTKSAITISWNAVTGAIGYLVLRNGKAVYKSNVLLFVDTEAIGKTTYHVRAIFPTGNYTQSNEIVVTPRILSANIMVVDKPAMSVDLITKIGERPSVGTQVEKTITPHYFAGRNQPVFDVSEHFSTVHSFEYAIKSKAEQDILDAMLQNGFLILFRHPQLQTRFYGVITSISKRITSLATYTFTVQECPEPDEVKLDV